MARREKRAPELSAELDEAQTEIEELRRKNERTYCAYCGYTVQLDAPNADATVHAHILNCEHHPLGILLRDAQAEIAFLRGRLIGIRDCGSHMHDSVAAVSTMMRIARDGLDYR